MFGLIEVITLLLGLAGFGLSPNPKAATSDQALHYAIPDADLVVHVDVTSIVSGNYRTLLALPSQPQIKSQPELLKIVRKVAMEVEGARNIATKAIGVDPASDITDATAFFQLVPNKPPVFLAAVRGRQLTPVVIDKIATVFNGKPVQVGGGRMVEMGGTDPAFGVTRDGVLLAGTPRLVRERLADTWRAPRRGAGSNLAHAAATIDAKPVLAWVVTLSQQARRDLGSKVGTRNLLADMVGRHRAHTASLFHDGIGWTWIDTTRPGLDQVATMSEGFVELLRASHIAPRAITKILLGAIDSYRGTNARVDELYRRKADLLRIVESYTGDGSFKVVANKDAAKLRLDVRATGKTISEVLPAGLIGPTVALALFTLRGASPVPPAITPAPKKP